MYLVPLTQLASDRAPTGPAHRSFGRQHARDGSPAGSGGRNPDVIRFRSRPHSSRVDSGQPFPSSPRQAIRGVNQPAEKVRNKCSPSTQVEPAFSPDGRWIAYTSMESGRFEVYVRPFPGGASTGSGKWQISTGGGLHPIWSRNGRELFYESPDNHIMAAAYTVKGDSFAVDKPRPWSNTQILGSVAGTSNLDLMPDGKRFAVFPRSEATGEQKGSVHVTVQLNSFDELQRRAPAGK
jgi:Tol biopolymer transport system component